MTIKIKITATGAHGDVTTIVGDEVPYERLTLGDMTDHIKETEEYLSRLTGLEVRIETGE